MGEGGGKGGGEQREDIRFSADSFSSSGNGRDSDESKSLGHGGC